MSVLRRERSDGYTLLELVMSVAFLLIGLVHVGWALHIGALATRNLRQIQIIQAQGQSFLDLMRHQNFGHEFDPAPTAGQVEEVFDRDLEGGDVTLHQLSRWPESDGGWRFQLAGFPVEGEWRVVVDRDLNGDGSVAGPLEEGNSTLRIQIFFRDELVLQTTRAKEVTL